ncbi:MAG: HAD-IA family hydrolase, partial [Dehalococcoidia bacterium]
MSTRNGIALIAFDCYGTLVRNEADQWLETLHGIALEQVLPLTGEEFWAVWRKHEIKFRETRTNMQDPASSPPFRTYWEAWRDAFVSTFQDLELEGSPDEAASRCVDALGQREPFADVNGALRELEGKHRLAVMSNSDDRSLLAAIQRNSWRFETVTSSEGAKAYKPDPRIFQALSQAAGVPPEAILYVGDSPYDDAHGAKLVGMQTVLVRRDQRTPG